MSKVSYRRKCLMGLTVLLVRHPWPSSTGNVTAAKQIWQPSISGKGSSWENKYESEKLTGTGVRFWNFKAHP